MVNVNFFLIYILILLAGFQNVICQETDKNFSIEIDTSNHANPWTHLNWQNDSKNFQFVVVTDRAGGSRNGVFKQGVKKINSLQPEFVISVGDLTEGYTHDPDQARKEWDELDKIVEHLQMPFFYVPGNHDIGNDIMADIWEERYGPAYYHFVYGNVLFLCLNTEEVRVDEEPIFSREQINYIRQALDENTDVRWTMVFLHKPLWLLEQREGKAALEQSGWAEIESMLKDRKHTVIAGHVHSYSHEIRNHSNYITMATMGGSRKFGSPIYGQFDHFMWVTMTDDGPIMANLMLEGIWDEDFSKEDIADYLFLTMHGTSIVLESQLDEEKPLTSQELFIRLTNPLDIPMDVTLYFDKGEHLYYTPATVTKTIQPNSAEKVSVSLIVTTETEAPLESEEEESVYDPYWAVWKDLQYHPIKWEISYNFEKYGKVSFQGSTLIYW